MRFCCGFGLLYCAALNTMTVLEHIAEWMTYNEKSFRSRLIKPISYPKKSSSFEGYCWKNPFTASCERETRFMLLNASCLFYVIKVFKVNFKVRQASPQLKFRYWSVFIQIVFWSSTKFECCWLWQLSVFVTNWPWCFSYMKPLAAFGD